MLSAYYIYDYSIIDDSAIKFSAPGSYMIIRDKLDVSVIRGWIEEARQFTNKHSEIVNYINWQLKEGQYL